MDKKSIGRPKDLVKRMKPYRKQYRFVIAICFNLGLFYLLYLWLQRNIHLDSLISDIEQTNLASVFFIFGFYLLILIAYGWRLSLLLKSNFRKAFYIIGIGNGLNNLLPFRLGDVLRIYFAKRFYDIDIPHATAATFMERYFDLIMLLIFGSVILLSQEYGFEVNALYIFLVLLSCSLFSIVLYRYTIVKDGFIRQWLFRFPRLKLLLNAIEDVVSTHNKLRVFITTIMIWLCTLAVYDVFFGMNLTSTSFGINGAIFLLFTTALSFAIPYAFAGIGVFETAIVYYLINYLHIIPTKALALALVFHFATAMPQLVLLAIVAVLHRARWLQVFAK